MGTARLFTTVISSGIVVIDPTVTGTRQISVQWLSGAPTVAGNVPTFKVKDGAGADQTLSSAAITMSATLNIINIPSNGVDNLKTTIDCSAGEVALVIYG